MHEKGASGYGVTEEQMLLVRIHYYDKARYGVPYLL